jgi:hypothetical protein
MGIRNSLNYAKYTYDFSVDGGAVSAIDLSAKAGAESLPLGAVINDIAILVKTTCTSGGSATVSVGNSASATAYSAATAVASLTAGALVTATGFPNAVGAANEQDIKVDIAVAALTAGKIEVHVAYYLGDA